MAEHVCHVCYLVILFDAFKKIYLDNLPHRFLQNIIRKCKIVKKKKNEHNLEENSSRCSKLSSDTSLNIDFLLTLSWYPLRETTDHLLRAL